MGKRQASGSRAGLAVLLLAGLLLSGIKSADSQIPISTANVSEQYLNVAANQERASVGLPALRLDPTLTAAAHRQAVVMADHKSISHRYAGEPDPTSRAAAAGARFSVMTENVGQAPSAVAVHSAWMHSDEHRHNLLDPRVDSVGISVVERDGQMFAVEDFAHSVALLSVGQQEYVVARRIRALGVMAEAEGAEARRVCAGEGGAEMRRPPDFLTRYTTDDLERLPGELVTRLHSGKYRQAFVGACGMDRTGEFSMYRVVVLLYPDEFRAPP